MTMAEHAMEIPPLDETEPPPLPPRPRYRLADGALEREELAVVWVLPEESDQVEVVVRCTRTEEDPTSA
jgi:hypothetical protein